MKSARLVRVGEGNAGTFGLFLTGGGWWYSMELPDRGNAQMISRIPAGRYTVQRTWSPRFKRLLYLVENVEGRTGIRIHAATWAGDKNKGYRNHLAGCIALGLRTGMVKGQAALLHSSRAVQDMTSIMGREPFILNIQEGM